MAHLILKALREQLSTHSTIHRIEAQAEPEISLE
jgi:hypothetical protein